MVRKNTLAIVLILLVVVICIIIIFNIYKERLIGGDRDSHGCYLMAGYRWNETDQRCVREWEKNYCTEEQRNFEVCITLYDPVCGYPVQETYSNSCVACLDEDVIYWISWKCETECTEDSDCIVFGEDGDCNCGCYLKDDIPEKTEGNCFCLAPKSCKCENGECVGIY